MEIPAIKVRWAKKNSMTIGDVAAAAAAITHGQLVEYVPRIKPSPSDRGYHTWLLM
jgi:hypothetical protein